VTKIALVHDWLNTRLGGSERVLLELANLFPEADIYTLLFRPAYYQGLIKQERIRTSQLSRLPSFLTERPRYLLPLVPTAIEQFDFSPYDIVISSSNAFSKGIITSPSTFHICYCHTPMRFAWDYWPRYLDEQKIGPVRRFAASRMISKTRLWDYFSAKRVDQWLANSEHVARRIKKFYGATAEVIHPPVATDHFSARANKADYYLTLATLTPYKQVDQAIAAAGQLGRKLIIVGDGFDRARLERLAGPTVEFAGRVSDNRKAELLAGARGLLVPQEEDFGIAMVEALASGTPVIAFGVGGAAEIIKPGQTGVLYPENSPQALAEAIKAAEAIKFDTQELRAASQAFNSKIFARQITQIVQAASRGQ
jgi:glycosyltransferase involved in cell wall biosynthesis